MFLEFNEVKTRLLSQCSQFPLGVCCSQCTSHIFSYVMEKFLLRIWISIPWDCVSQMTQFDGNNFHSQSGNESIGQRNEHVIELFQQYRHISSKNLQCTLMFSYLVIFALQLLNWISLTQLHTCHLGFRHFLETQHRVYIYILKAGIFIPFCSSELILRREAVTV